MDDALLESLLYQEESATLDFKLEQYPFVKATAEQKSEILEDILAFANAWRQTDAYILIGVKEVRGGPSIVAGIPTGDQLACHLSGGCGAQQCQLYPVHTDTGCSSCGAAVPSSDRRRDPLPRGPGTWFAWTSSTVG
jgi:hypothetical protein